MKIVIKIGTSTLAHKTGRLNIKRTEEICKIIADLKNAGNDIIIVSSGAIGMGVGKLSLTKRPNDMATKQAAAAVGQCELMYTYDRLFSKYGYTVGQILITASDIRKEDRHVNFRNTLNRLLKFNAIPVINENDSVATEEIEIGDNDTLAAYVAESSRADLAILLSDIDGLYTADPHTNKDAQLIKEVYKITDGIKKLGSDNHSGLSVGGMKTKITAASICMKAGCDMIICNGANPELLYDIVDGKQVGTRFFAK